MRVPAKIAKRALDDDESRRRRESVSLCRARATGSTYFFLFFSINNVQKSRKKNREKKLIMSLDRTKETSHSEHAGPRDDPFSSSSLSSFPSRRERARVVVSLCLKREEQLIDVCTRCAFPSRRRGRMECVVSFPRATTGPEPTQHQTERRE